MTFRSAIFRRLLMTYDPCPYVALPQRREMSTSDFTKGVSQDWAPLLRKCASLGGSAHLSQSVVTEKDGGVPGAPSSSTRSSFS